MFEHDWITASLLFLLGLIVGSFTNVLIWRMPRRESIVFPGSHCPKCNAPIKFYHNIPILSYIILGGKCRQCKEKISFRYPAVELIMGSAYAATYLLHNPQGYIDIIRMILLFPVFVAITFIDWEHLTIPDELTISIAIVGLATAPFMGGWQNLIHCLIGGAAGIFLFWLISILGKKAFRKEALGEGDIFLMGSVGLLVRWDGMLLTIFLSALLGTIGGAIMMIFRGKKKKGEDASMIPYGPFIIFATLITMIFQDEIIQRYLSLFR